MEKYICIADTIFYRANSLIGVKVGDSFFVMMWNSGGYWFFSENIVDDKYWVGGAAEHTPLGKSFDQHFIHLAKWRDIQINEILE